MTVSTINKKQLTVDTSFVENENETEYEPQQYRRLMMATNEQVIQPTTPPRIVPAYCARRDGVIKIVMVCLLALLNAFPLVMDWYFNPVGVAINTFRRMATFCCYTLVIITTDLDDILNSKQSTTTSKKLFCRFIGYCDWIIAFVEIAEGLLHCLEHFVIYGELLSPYILYASINKIILYVYVLKNI